MLPEVKIGDRKIGVNHEPYIICEISANHNGCIKKALELITVAASTGCDAIKLQTYTPDTMTIDHDSEDFMIHGGLWDGFDLFFSGCVRPIFRTDFRSEVLIHLF